jgi:hypothetical protein
MFKITLFCLFWKNTVFCLIRFIQWNIQHLWEWMWQFEKPQALLGWTVRSAPLQALGSEVGDLMGMVGYIVFGISLQVKAGRHGHDDHERYRLYVTEVIIVCRVELLVSGWMVPWHFGWISVWCMDGFRHVRGTAKGTATSNLSLPIGVHTHLQ